MTIKILVIDDSYVTTSQLDLTLSKAGFEVSVSNEIDDGLKKFIQGDFDIVTVDLFFPTEKEGLDLLRKLKSHAQLCKMKTVIIVISASPKNEHEQKCLNFGADAYVEKDEDWCEKLITLINKRIYDENK